MKQTAVEWLIGQLYAPCRGIPSHIIEQAKEMEMRQIMEAFNAGEHYDGSDGEIKYYNETFNTKEK